MAAATDEEIVQKWIGPSNEWATLAVDEVRRNHNTTMPDYVWTEAWQLDSLCITAAGLLILALVAFAAWPRREVPSAGSAAGS